MNLPKGSIIDFSSIYERQKENLHSKKPSIDWEIPNEDIENDSEKRAISLKDLNLSLLERSVVSHSPSNSFIIRNSINNGRDRKNYSQSFPNHLK